MKNPETIDKQALQGFDVCRRSPGVFALLAIDDKIYEVIHWSVGFVVATVGR